MPPTYTQFGHARQDKPLYVVNCAQCRTVLHVYGDSLQECEQVANSRLAAHVREMHAERAEA